MVITGPSHTSFINVFRYISNSLQARDFPGQTLQGLDTQIKYNKIKMFVSFLFYVYLESNPDWMVRQTGFSPQATSWSPWSRNSFKAEPSLSSDLFFYSSTVHLWTKVFTASSCCGDLSESCSVRPTFLSTHILQTPAAVGPICPSHCPNVSKSDRCSIWQMASKAMVRWHPHHACCTALITAAVNNNDRLSSGIVLALLAGKVRNSVQGNVHPLWVIEFGSKTHMSSERSKGLLSF